MTPACPVFDRRRASQRVSPANPFSSACVVVGCRQPVTSRGRCHPHAVPRDRPRANVAVRRLYRTVRWQRLRRLVLSEEPLCCDCQAEGHVQPSEDVDHVIPHRGDSVLFWSRKNLVGRCHAHHAAKTARGE